MYHLSRPSYLRRLLATGIVVVAVAVELAPPDTEPLAVAVSDLAAGTQIREADISWVEAPTGLFPPLSLPAVLARPVPAGSPITALDSRQPVTRIPESWLLLELEVPPTTPDGAPIVAVLAANGTTQALSGVVAGDPRSSDFGGSSSLVAFAPEDAVAIAAALMAGEVAVLLGN